MNGEFSSLVPFFGFFAILLFVIGLYCVVMSRNFIRVLIGLEILTKGVTLLIIAAGYLTGKVALAQTLAITLIVLEVVVVAVAAGIVIAVYRRNNSLDVTQLRKLKG
ncbi:MAG: NADH-quinone oxidoreductase subunit K [Verrucomicrobiae bacterium]|nr:NADH-quinone oxidoreductase subunit K [Verrucomicrobiae bacterium]